MSNHIANKIEAKDKNLGKIFLNERFKIDVFQREYRWHRKHIEALISDLSISFQSSYKEGDTIEKYDSYDSYYMGPIVLCNDQGSLSIVDGQQRLTSFTLLLIHLHHLQHQLNLDSNLIKDFKQFIFVTKGGKTTLILDIESREEVINLLFENPESITENFSKDESVNNIIARYEDITKLFPKEIGLPDILPLFIEWLLEKVVLVEVKAFSMENAYTIFETMNDRGMNLSPTEMLKGYLLSKVSDIEKSYELNEFWKERIISLKASAGSEADLEFIRAWLRAKYAESKRVSKQGSENEDFEIIGTQFHSWIKKNATKIGLVTNDDFYFFISSDFEYYSSIYKKIFEARRFASADFEYLYITNFYSIADSLAYPLFLSPITKTDQEINIESKILAVGIFIDVYTNLRTILGRTITQSSIRSSMYELIKTIRNADEKNLLALLSAELSKSIDEFGAFAILHRMDNWGYYHYFFARILFKLGVEKDDFSQLLRSRKQSSFVLTKIFQEDEIDNDMDEAAKSLHLNAVANFCLVKRNEIDDVDSTDADDRISYLIDLGYLPEMDDEVKQYSIIDFISHRDNVLRGLVKEIWPFAE